MKCPKCGYLGFERVDRCKNCQYDFSLSSTIPDPDFTIRRDNEMLNPLEDLSLIDGASEWPERRPMADVGADLDRVFGGPEPERAAGPSMSLAAVAELPRPAPAPARREELPLFGPPIPDDEPLITRASPPRP